MQALTLPILYSYRRCPYAMRARMALKLADIPVEIREISLREKPAHMLKISPKGTVPVLQLLDGTVIDESLEIIFFALKTHALGANIHAGCRPEVGRFSLVDLILENDRRFKKALDAYKYPERYPDQTQIQHRAVGEIFLKQLESLLNQHDYLFGESPSMADIAIFPFVRQFAAVDDVWWQTQPYRQLYIWLNNWLQSELFKSVMTKNPTHK